MALELIAEIEGDSPVNESVMTESILPDIPTRVMSWLKEVAEVTKKVSAKEVTTIRYTDDNKKKLRKWHQKWNAAMKADDQAELDHVGELVKKLVR